MTAESLPLLSRHLDDVPQTDQRNYRNQQQKQLTNNTISNQDNQQRKQSTTNTIKNQHKEQQTQLTTNTISNQSLQPTHSINN